ncbi:hypothetical protein C10C_0437 [Chlamydia serpentis]|uniref:Uncharacterized protein n=1 Tax=Chlamydia serpentis TaxID=1967782 RepID=A0A2R8FB20_9CHLA|nr:hypothetical protein [Chlamydia serpentis]SPN73604.1 hypothetical protein C10C_0437 [Chlamydia serpentis]
MVGSFPLTSSNIGEALSRHEKSIERASERTSRMYYAALILGALSCLIFIAMIVIFPQVGLWAIALGCSVGCLLLGLAIVFAVSALVLGKTLGPSPEPIPKIPVKKEWTSLHESLGNYFWRIELASLFLLDYLPESLVVYSQDRSLDIDRTLKNILELEPLSTTLLLLKKDCVHINIILHLVRQWNLQEIELNSEVTQCAEELLQFLIEEQYYSEDLLQLARYGDALKTSSPLLDWATSGRFCVNEDEQTFTYRQEECSPEVALFQFDLLLSLENPDRLFLKDSFLTYIWSSSFFEAFLRRHLASLVERLPGQEIDVLAYERKIEGFLSRYLKKLDTISSFSLDWGHSFVEGARCYKSAEQRLEKLFVDFSSAILAMRRLFEKYTSIKVEKAKIKEQLIMGREMIQNEGAFYCSLYQYPLSYFIDWATLLESIHKGGISEEDQPDYAVCLRGLDSMLSFFGERFKLGRKAFANPRAVLSEQQGIILVNSLATQGMSFQGLKSLMYLISLPERIWLGALPLFESSSVSSSLYDQLKEFLDDSRRS